MVSVRDSVTSGEVRGPDAFDLLREREATATHSWLCQPLFVPGMLQVRSYAQEMISATVGRDLTVGELDIHVTTRMSRASAFEARLRGSAPPEFSVVIDESVFRRVGEPEVMREQVTHLVTMATKFKAALRLSITRLDHGPHVGLRGSFELHRSADGTTTAFFEAPLEDRLVSDDPAVFDPAYELFGTVKAAAVSGDDAIGLLETISGDL